MDSKPKIHITDLYREYYSHQDEPVEIKEIKPIWKERLESCPELSHLQEELEKVETEAQFVHWLAILSLYCNIE